MKHKILSAAQIRSGFIDFFKSKGHEYVPSSPIVPAGDETLLFANAGMNQFKDIFLGLVSPSIRRAANSQKCLRVSGKHNDLEEVGMDTYHHTFFEMLGNWSFDDYFKAEAIEWAWELLTEVWGIEPGRLWATVFTGDEADGLPKDEEAAEIWTKVTPIPAERVLAYGRKDNFWEMGDTGPCGPCSEIHIDLGPDMCDKKDTPGHKCTVNGGCSRFIELWNLVFIQYNRTDNGKLLPLGARYVDTGAGLERVTAVLQNKRSNYDTDLFMPIINRVSDITGHKYNSQLGNKTDNAFRVIADHIRTLVFAVTDGAIPSNDGRGYVIRRILRRASRYARELGMHEPFLYKLVPNVVDVMGDAFGEIKERAEFVSTVIESEEASFGRTLDRGIEIFADAAKRAGQTAGKTISGDDAFQLYDTYGFPLDLTQLMAKERELKVDTAKFDELMEEQRQRARAAQKGDSIISTLSDTELPVTEDMHKYRTDSCDAIIVGWIDKEGFKNKGKISAGNEVAIILDKTCFYAEAGGQVGDCGIIKSNGSQFIVESTTKIASCVLHQGHLAEGIFNIGDKVTAIVSKDRDSIKKNHTATHLLQWALQDTLGKSVAQQGSFVGPDYLRFDFTYPKAPTAEELKEAERKVREKIAEDLPVTWAVLPKEQAQKLGAMALFGEKYGNEVRVVGIGAESENGLSEAISREFCGGTHVDRLGYIGGFKIIKEESVSAGVRRITALTGHGLEQYLQQRSDIVDQLSGMLKVPAETITSRIEQLLAENKRLSKELKSAGTSSGVDTMAEAGNLLANCQKIDSASIIIGQLSNAPIERAREAVDMLKKKAKSAAIVLGFADGDKVTLLAGVTDDLVKKGLNAGDIVKAISPIVDGGGGGRPQMAQAGGKKPDKINEALAKAAEIIKQKLQNTS
ncbi:MAG: alanine--tRNA ligase [Planctomycetes bacterium RBG_13_46_10]|nr:MAG: alanine--tRNA ligase [Planctomycetes bacterium RBG_13_46_10]